MRRAVIRPVQRAEQRCAAPPAAARGPGPFTAQKAVPGEYLYFSTKRNPLQRPVKAEMLKKILLPLFPKAYLENYKHCLFPTAAAFRVKNLRHPIRDPCFFFGKSLAPGKTCISLIFKQSQSRGEKEYASSEGIFVRAAFRRRGELAPRARRGRRAVHAWAASERSAGDEEQCMIGTFPSARRGTKSSACLSRFRAISRGRWGGLRRGRGGRRRRGRGAV